VQRAYNRDRIFKLLRSLGIDSTSQCSLADRYNIPTPSQFLAPTDCSQVPTQDRTPPTSLVSLPPTLHSSPRKTKYTDKKENQIFLIYKEIQNGAVAK
jgi:hypothetical protein